MNTAVHIICRLLKFHHMTDLLMNPYWLPVRQHLLFNVLVLTYHPGIFYVIMLEI